MKKDIIKSLIAIKQSEIPFDVIDRDVKLPLNRQCCPKRFIGTMNMRLL